MCSDVAQPQDGPNSSPDSPFWAGGESEFFSSKPQIFGRSHQKRPKVVKNSSNGLMTKCPKNGHVFPSAATVMQHVVMHNCCAAAQSHVSLSFRHFFSAMPQTSLCLLILIGAPQRQPQCSHFPLKLWPRKLFRISQGQLGQTPPSGE